MLKQMLFKYQGQISAALVLGGMDINGPALYSIYPHGSVDKLPYVTMGSGSLAAMGVFEDGFKPDMTKEEGCELVRQAIRAGIFNDLGYVTLRYVFVFVFVVCDRPRLLQGLQCNPLQRGHCCGAPWPRTGGNVCSPSVPDACKEKMVGVRASSKCADV